MVMKSAGFYEIPTFISLESWKDVPNSSVKDVKNKQLNLNEVFKIEIQNRFGVLIVEPCLPLQIECTELNDNKSKRKEMKITKAKRNKVKTKKNKKG